MTFDQFFREFRLTNAERHALVWHLASYRARKTVEALLPKSRSKGRAHLITKDQTHD